VKRLVLIRLQPGTVIFGWGLLRQIRIGDVVIFSHSGLEKVKRIGKVNGDRVYVLGDNATASTDSRQFGWVNKSQILGLVIWPRIVNEP